MFTRMFLFFYFYFELWRIKKRHLYSFSCRIGGPCPFDSPQSKAYHYHRRSLAFCAHRLAHCIVRHLQQLIGRLFQVHHHIAYMHTPHIFLLHCGTRQICSVSVCSLHDMMIHSVVATTNQLTPTAFEEEREREKEREWRRKKKKNKEFDVKKYTFASLLYIVSDAFRSYRFRIGVLHVGHSFRSLEQPHH